MAEDQKVGWRERWSRLVGRGGGGRVPWLSMIFQPAVAHAEVRREVWRLGGRHRGEALQGALEELRQPNLSMGRAVLLRACVDKLRQEAAA